MPTVAICEAGELCGVTARFAVYEKAMFFVSLCG